MIGRDVELWCCGLVTWEGGGFGVRIIARISRFDEEEYQNPVAEQIKLTKRAINLRS